MPRYLELKIAECHEPSKPWQLFSGVDINKECPSHKMFDFEELLGIQTRNSGLDIEDYHEVGNPNINDIVQLLNEG